MAEAAKRSSANTDLFIGTLGVSVGLFGTNAKPAGLPGFETAGPNGGRLKYEMRGAPAPAPVEGVESLPVEEGASDPLAETPAVARSSEPSSAGAMVDGEFRQVLVEEGSGEVVESDAVRRGVRLDDGRFVDCTEQLGAIEARTKLERIDIERCIDSTRIRRQRVVGARYVGGQDAEAMAALSLLWHALRANRQVAVVKYTLRKRQYLGVIEAGTGGLLVLLDLVWSEDWRAAPAKARVGDVAVPAEQVEKMGALLGALHGTVDVLDELRDDAIALREELLVRAQAGEMDVTVVEPLPAEPAVADLEGALVASLAAVRSGKV